MVIAWAGSVIVAFFGGIWVDRLTARREAKTRRRNFRAAVRTIAATLESCRYIALYRTYRESLPRFTDECSKVVEDIRFWRRKRFTECQRHYSAFREDDILPPRRAITNEEIAAAKKQHGQGKIMLVHALEDMVRYAK